MSSPVLIPVRDDEIVAGIRGDDHDDAGGAREGGRVEPVFPCVSGGGRVRGVALAPEEAAPEDMFRTGEGFVGQGEELLRAVALGRVVFLIRKDAAARGECCGSVLIVRDRLTDDLSLPTYLVL